MVSASTSGSPHSTWQNVWYKHHWGPIYFRESWTDADIQFPMSIDKAGSLYTIQHIGTIFSSNRKKGEKKEQNPKTYIVSKRLNASSEFKDACTAE